VQNVLLDPVHSCFYSLFLNNVNLHLKPNLLIVKGNECMFVGCSLWTRKANTAADNGVFYAITSESECMAECLTSATCLAFDLTPFGCTLHNNADDLTTAYYAPEVTQFVLNRHCLLTSPLSTETSRTTSALTTISAGV